MLEATSLIYALFSSIQLHSDLKTTDSGCWLPAGKDFTAPQPQEPVASALPPHSRLNLSLPSVVQQALYRLLKRFPFLDTTLDSAVLRNLQSLSSCKADLGLYALEEFESRDPARLDNPSAFLMRILNNIRTDVRYANQLCGYMLQAMLARVPSKQERKS